MLDPQDVHALKLAELIVDQKWDDLRFQLTTAPWQDCKEEDLGWMLQAVAAIGQTDIVKKMIERWPQIDKDTCAEAFEVATKQDQREIVALLRGLYSF